MPVTTKLFEKPFTKPFTRPVGGRLSGGGVTYSAEATALFARFTTPPTDARKLLIDNRIGALKTAGVWTLLDCDYVMAAADNQAARQNWKQDLYNLTGVGSPTFTADRGFAGDGASSYLTTGFIPSTASGQFSLDSSHMGHWSRDDISSAGVDVGCRTASTTGQTLVQSRNGSNASFRLSQAASGTSITSLISSGGFLVRRPDSATTELFRNGASLGVSSIVSTVLSTAAVVIGGLNTGGVVSSFSARQYAGASMGANLSNAQILAKYNADLAYFQAIGAA